MLTPEPDFKIMRMCMCTDMFLSGLDSTADIYLYYLQLLNIFQSIHT